MAKNPQYHFGVSLKGVSEKETPLEVQNFNHFLREMHVEHPEKKHILPAGVITVMDDTCHFAPSSGSIGVSSMRGTLENFLGSLEDQVKQYLGVAVPTRGPQQLEFSEFSLAAG